MISWVVMDRVVERERAQNAAYRKKTAGRPLRSDGKRLSDDELLEKLRSFGLELERPTFELLCDRYLSSEEITKLLIRDLVAEAKIKGFDSDWIWICLTVLWERWFPNKPSFEMLDDKIQAGYEMRASKDPVGVCSIWLDAWKDVKQIIERGRYTVSRGI